MFPSGNTRSFNMAGSLQSSQTIVMSYFCDAGCRPNPGMSIPLIIHAGIFLTTPPRGVQGNHTAIYDAVDAALAHAAAAGATDVIVELSQPHVFHQMARAMGLKILTARQVRTEAATKQFRTVQFQLTRPPYLVGTRTLNSTKALRKELLRTFQKGGKTMACASSVPATLPSSPPSTGSAVASLSPGGATASSGANAAQGASNP